jgi:UDP-2,4-diacetamido-2,4,6-trideoxy-beta-L-altropyranose hydrolase
MKIAFRVDASPQMGIGHLGRCLALGHALLRCGAAVTFVTRDLGVDSAARIRAAGFEARALPAPGAPFQPSTGAPPHAAWAGVPQEVDAGETLDALADFAADWIVVDHYAFDRRWHARLRTATRRVCIVDDLADRALDADLLVDHNPAPDHRAKYATTTDAATRLLGGVRYALLGPAYADAPRHVFRAEVGSIGIFLGGTDLPRLSQQALRACREVARFDGPIEIVTTSANPDLAALCQACAETPDVRLAVDLPDLAAFFARHDLQIGAGGGAAWERCCIGAPALTLQWADNQAVVLAALAAAGAARCTDDLSVQGIGRAVAELVEDAGARRALADAARGWIDGRGAERVALALHADAVVLRPAALEDAAAAHRWRNDARTRRHFRDPSPVAWESHLEWWSRSLQDGARRLLIACCGTWAIGSVRFDVAESDAEISLYVDPELTGLGLGRGLLEAAKRWVDERMSGVRRIVAEVLPDNLASMNAFRAAGFAPVGASRWVWETAA